MKWVLPSAFFALLVLLSAGLEKRVAETSAAPPAPELLALFDRQDVIDAPRVDFVRVADIDGDGDPDFLAVEPEEQDIHWWENNGDGTDFTEHAITTLSHNVTIVSPGDLDGDGDVDFLALAPEQDTLSFWFNNGTGGFTHQTTENLRVLGMTYVEATDVNGDGYADFFAVAEGAKDIAWWENTGQPETISFQEHEITNFSAFSGTVTRVDAADIDGDGLVDFVGANPDGGRITWWRHEVDSEGQHTFEEQTPGYSEEAVIDVSAADVDGDGDLDIFAARRMPYRVFLWENRGDAEFHRISQTLSDSPGDRPWRSVDSGDVNGDGAVDFVVSEWDGQLCWYKNPDVQPTPPATTTTPTSTSTATMTLSPTATSTATATATATVTVTVTSTPGETHEVRLPLLRRSGP